MLYGFRMTYFLFRCTKKLYQRRLFLSLFLLLFPGALQASTVTVAEKKIHMQLNKTEKIQDGCRVTLVVRNKLPQTIKKLGSVFVFFDHAGTVFSMLDIDLDRFPGGKTAVRQFDLSGLDCDNISKVLVNDISTCEGTGLNPSQCLEYLAVSSHSGLPALEL